MKQLRFLGSAAIMLTITSIVMAQIDTTCPAIVRTALESARLVCADTGRNQACYANSMLDAELHADRTDVSFEQIGDKVDMAAINSLRLSAMDEAVSQWGVALMEIQANIPDSSPENVTLLMFGDVAVHDVSSSLPTAELQTITNLNIRRGSSLNSAVIDSAVEGETVVANGRLADNSWVRIHLPDDAVGYGWMHAGGLRGPLETLAEVEPSEPVYGPMQAFTLETETAASPCEEAPASGLLIQTPEGVGEVRLVLNQVSVRLGSTVFFQAERDSEMRVTVFEGHAVLTAEDHIVYVPAGAQATVPMTDDLQPAGPPQEVQPYDADAFNAFSPVVNVLPQSVAIAEPLPASELPYFQQLNEPLISSVRLDRAGDTVSTTVNTVTGTVDSALTSISENGLVNGVLGEQGVVESVAGALPVGGEIVGNVVDVVQQSPVGQIIENNPVDAIVQESGVVEVVAQTVDTVTDAVDETTENVAENVDEATDEVTQIGTIVQNTLRGLLGK